MSQAKLGYILQGMVRIFHLQVSSVFYSACSFAMSVTEHFVIPLAYDSHC